MLLSPHEQERLLLHVAAGLARQRRERGLKLNYPEAVAVISSWVLEGARDGRGVAELMSGGQHVLSRDGERLSARGDDAHARSAAHHRGHDRCGRRKQVLAVVEDEQ